MRYRLLTIGKLKRSFYREGCDFYIKRLKNFGPVEVIELKEVKHSERSLVQQLESEALLKASQGYSIALDERGLTLNSKQLAKRLSQLENRGHSQLSLIIGGAEGHSKTLRENVAESWQISSMTLPHELSRLVLLEQLYRAESIRAGHPYHRE